MQATVMLAISELSARAAKRTVPIHIAVAADPNAELLRTRYGRSGNRNRSERSKSISSFLHGFLLLDYEENGHETSAFRKPSWEFSESDELPLVPDGWNLLAGKTF
jgi:hypothetical protein